MYTLLTVNPDEMVVRQQTVVTESEPHVAATREHVLPAVSWLLARGGGKMLIVGDGQKSEPLS